MQPNHHHNLILGHFYHPKKETTYLSAVPASGKILSVSIDLPILTFCINGIIQYVAFPDWPLSRRMVFKVHHVVAGVSTSFLFTAR